MLLYFVSLLMTKEKMSLLMTKEKTVHFKKKKKNQKIVDLGLVVHEFCMHNNSIAGHTLIDI